MSEQTVREQLVTLLNTLGRSELDYAILGEGNTSARIWSASFWGKRKARFQRMKPGFFVAEYPSEVRRGLARAGLRIGFSSYWVLSHITALSAG